MLAVRRSLALSLVLAVGLFIGLAACDDGIVDPDPDPDPDPVQDDEPLPELPGEPDETVAEATFDFSATPDVETQEEFEEQVSTKIIDDVERRILRTEIEIAFEEGATVGEVNAILDEYDARIMDMLPGLRFIGVRIPDPGGLSSLQQVIDKIENESQVQRAREATLPNTNALPDNIAPIIGDYINAVQQDDIKNHLSVRGHAAWNLRGAINEDEAPWLVIADRFGDGQPDNRFSGTFREPDDFDGWFSRSDNHGYSVLGVMNAAYGGNSTATGIFPDQLNVRAVNVLAASVWSTENRIIRRITDIIEEGGSNIVVNTSIGDYPASQDDAKFWKEKVRQEGLEDQFIHFSAAGNLDVANDPAYRASSYNYAALGPGIDNLTNTFVVENRWPNPDDTKLEDATRAERPIPGCLYNGESGSVSGGSLSGIGTDVYVLGRDGDQSDTQRMAGTSFAAPQATGTAAFMWGVAPSLSMKQIYERIESTTRDLPETTEPGDCRSAEPAPVIDTYDAVLAAGGDHVRRVLLDVNETGTFDETDIEVFLSEWDERDGQLDYSRYDLNGTGQTGGDAIDRFDLNHDISFSTVSQTIEGEDVTFDEEAVTDADVLCYYSYSDLFGGDHQVRAEMLADLCLGVEDTQATISGTITDEETGEGIEGATVTGTDPATGSGLFETETDDWGEYEMTFTVEEAPSDVIVKAIASGHEVGEKQVPFTNQMTANFVLEETGRAYGPEFRYAPGDGYEYFITVKEYSVDQDIPALLEEEFGSEAELVEWNTIVDLFSESEGDLIEFLNGIGMKRGVEGYENSAYVTRNGNRFHSGSRHYFISRHDGNVPGGWLVHDHLHSNRISLGSWPNDREAMVRLPE